MPSKDPEVSLLSFPSRPKPILMGHDQPTAAEGRTAPSPPTLLWPFPLEVLAMILTAADADTCVTCLRVNSTFYDIVVPAVYHTVMVFRDEHSRRFTGPRGNHPFPLTTPRSAKLASYVRVFDVGPHQTRDCHDAFRLVPSFPSFPNVRTVRLRLRQDVDPFGKDRFHTDTSQSDPRPCSLLTRLRPRTLVIRAFGTQTAHRSIFDRPDRTISDSTLSSVREVVVVFESNGRVRTRGGFATIRSLAAATFPHAVKFTFIFWTERPGDAWYASHTRGFEQDSRDGYMHPGMLADARRGRLTWSEDSLSLVDFLSILFRQPLPDGGEPLLTIVNIGVYRQFRGELQLRLMVADGKLSDAECAAKMERRLKRWFDEACNALDAAFPGDSVYSDDWDPATRDKQHHMRFLSMEEFLATHNGDVFDDDELVGWR